MRVFLGPDQQGVVEDGTEHKKEKGNLFVVTVSMDGLNTKLIS